MPIYTISENRESQGQGAGVICSKADMPFIPGDLQNASSFEFPIVYELMHEVEARPGETQQQTSIRSAVKTAIALEKAGARCITSNSGMNLAYQEPVSAAVKVPVGVSALLQIPIIAGTLNSSQTIGVLCSSDTQISTEWLSSFGISVPNPLAFYGLQRGPEMKNLFDSIRYFAAGRKGSEPRPLDPKKLEAEILEVGYRLMREHPNTGAVLLECTDFGPYAKALQEAVELPVFDIVSLVSFMYKSTNRHAFEGFM